MDFSDIFTNFNITVVIGVFLCIMYGICSSLSRTVFGLEEYKKNPW